MCPPGCELFENRPAPFDLIEYISLAMLDKYMLYQKNSSWMVVHTCNAATQEAGRETSLGPV
jgi:hypothetical protein